MVPAIIMTDAIDAIDAIEEVQVMIRERVHFAGWALKL